MAQWGEAQVEATAIKGGATGKMRFMQTVGLDQSLDLISVGHGRTDFQWVPGRHLMGMDNLVMGGMFSVVADICQGHTYLSRLDSFHGFSTGDIQVRFIKPVLVETELHVVSHVASVAGKLTLIDTQFIRADQTVVVTAHGGWRVVDRKFEKTR